MTAPNAHQVDVFVAYLTIIGWLSLLLLLEQVEDPRVRWARLASFGPLHQAYDRLPHEWSLHHAVLVIAAALWLGAVLVPTSKLRPRLLVATATCLTFLATAWALHPEHSLASAEAGRPVTGGSTRSLVFARTGDAYYTAISGSDASSRRRSFGSEVTT